MKNIRAAIILFISFQAFLTSAQVCPGTEGQVLWECWQGLYDDEFGELYADPNYPNHPDVVQTRYKTQFPVNYDNYMGARMEGFLNIDSTEDVVFNVTGNARVHFFLSTDSDPANKVLRAFTNSSTSEEDHDAYPEQTSDSITLLANTDYYFEIVQVEGSSSDHAALWWKTDLVDVNNWNIITAAFIKGVGCKPAACPPRGTPCDDMDASTNDDMEDGYCNCLGSPSTANPCVGQRGLVEAYQYDSIPGGDLNDLYVHPDYPAMPFTSRVLNTFGTEYSSTDDKGDLMQAYLIVPVTGDYKFNVTGDDETILFISSDDDPANKQAHQAFVSGWTYMTQHDKYIWQSTSFFTLTAGTPYYIEINHKQGGGGEHFSAFWQTPFTEADTWKRIPSMYFLDYDCEISCIPQGTLCDDGDPFTNNDMYDANCDCVGIPCSGPDCDSPLANYVPYDKCSVTDQINNNPDNNWLSCQVGPSPNPARPLGHWIQYDLGVKHELYQTQVWNYNVENETDKGFEMVAVDYSLDGVTWNEYGTYTWPLATGESHYSGFMGPNFMGTEARYILISSQDDTSTCRGIAKIAFTAIKCPGEGYPCDDGNPLTTDDQYDGNCICQGVDFLENRCEDDFLVLGDTVLTTNNFSAIDYVQSISTIDDSEKVSFVGGNSVTLDVGFNTDEDAIFIASIDTCDVTPFSPDNVQNRKNILSSKQEQHKLDEMSGLQVIDTNNDDIHLIKFYLDKPGDVRIDLINQDQEIVHTLINHKYQNKGLYSKRLRTKKLAPGIYMVKLTTNTHSELEKMSVI